MRGPMEGSLRGSIRGRARGLRPTPLLFAAALGSVAVALGCGGPSTDPHTGGGPPHDGGSTISDGAVAPTAACKATAMASMPVARPVFVRNLPAGETGWFSSPAAVDLDGDGKKEIVAPLYSTFVYRQDGTELAKGTATKGRVYAPGVVADLDGDGTTEIVVGGNDGTVAAYEWKSGGLQLKAGWASVSTCSGAAMQCPEARGMAAGDLDGDGKIEVAVTTTQTEKDGAQVFVFSPDGSLYQPKGTPFPAWPRYNTATGSGGDADWNGPGNHGYGCYGENVGIGNLDDDPDLELVVTYDDHQINVFKHDGTSMLASDWFTNPATMYLGNRMGWGQFIRWLDPAVEEAHYHSHTGDWPSVDTTMWLEWTASPPNVVDVDGDGKNDVVGVPNAEEHEPYVTQAYAFMALHGGQSNGMGGTNAARRVEAFTNLPLSDQPPVRASGDYYPPDGIPAPTTVDLVGDARPEILAPIDDGYLYAISPDGQRLWRYDYSGGAAKTFASEAVVADLNQDGAPEVIFGVYSLVQNGGRLVVLANTGALLYDVTLPNQGMDGNGIGVPAAPTVADLDGDGTLEIVVTTFDHGVDVFTVPGSSGGCLLWPTGRGNLLRSGAGPSTLVP